MNGNFLLRTRGLGGLASTLLALGAGACESRLSSDLSGHACDAQNHCLAGWVCDLTTRLCVEKLDGSPDPSGRCSGDACGGAGGSAGAASGECEDDRTSCEGECVDTSRDPAHCGGCGARCSAPADGVPVCVGGRCNFVCD